MLNKQLLDILEENRIPDTGILYLLAIYYNLDAQHLIDDDVQKKVNMLKIVERDYDADEFTIKWNMPLMEGEKPTVSHWDWVDDWRKLFKQVNPERTGVKQYCIARMKRFFSKYPNYRQDDVMKATRAYLSTISDPKYCKKAHRFIYEDSGVNEYSLLLEWCERTKGSDKYLKFKQMGK